MIKKLNIYKICSIFIFSLSTTLMCDKVFAEVVIHTYPTSNYMPYILDVVDEYVSDSNDNGISASSIPASASIHDPVAGPSISIFRWSVMQPQSVTGSFTYMVRDRPDLGYCKVEFSNELGGDLDYHWKDAVVIDNSANTQIYCFIQNNVLIFQCKSFYGVSTCS